MAAIREKAGISQAVMAKRLNLNKNTLGSYERGNTLPSRETVVKFGRLTESDTDELVTVWEMSYHPAGIAHGRRLKDEEPPVAQEEVRPVSIGGRRIDLLTIADTVVLVEDAVDESGVHLEPGHRSLAIAIALHHALTTKVSDEELHRFTIEACKRLA
ncbi:MAG: helix-turn-helix transcriptional regulator [Hypericibacter sp.]